MTCVCVSERVTDYFPKTDRRKTTWALLGVLQDLYPHLTSRDRIAVAVAINELNDARKGN